MFKLRTELSTMWAAGEHKAALEELRKVASPFRNELVFSVLAGRHETKPYGRFSFHHYLDLLSLLYHVEFHLGNFAEAMSVCDELITDKKPRRDLDDYWHVNKARVLRVTEGDLSAKEYLLKYVNPADRDNVVNKYIEELDGE